MLTSSKI